MNEVQAKKIQKKIGFMVMMEGSLFIILANFIENDLLVMLVSFILHTGIMLKVDKNKQSLGD